MIERVSFANFKSLRRVDNVGLQRLTVIVGPNGSGKTSVLDGLHYLAQVTQRPLGSILGGVFTPQNLHSRDAEGPMKLALEGRVGEVPFAVEIDIESNETARPADWRASVTRRWGEATARTAETAKAVTRELAKAATRGPAKAATKAPAALREPGSAPKPATRPQPLGPPVVNGLRGLEGPAMVALEQQLGSVRKLRLDAGTLAAPSYSREETPRLAIDGRGLASVLAEMAGRSPEVFQSIQEAARQIIPTLERIRTRRAKVREQEQQEIVIDGKALVHGVDRDYWGHQIALDFKGAPDVPAALASEGTLLVIGLLTALWSEPRPRLLLLDDVDKALHPTAQGERVARLREVLAMDPGLQIVATSHSPYLLDHFEAREVLVTALRPDGSTACAPLTAHPDFNRWQGTARTGEMWSFLGEDWIVSPAPAEPGA